MGVDLKKTSAIDRGAAPSGCSGSWRGIRQNTKRVYLSLLSFCSFSLGNRLLARGQSLCVQVIDFQVKVSKNKGVRGTLVLSKKPAAAAPTLRLQSGGARREAFFVLDSELRKRHGLLAEAAPDPFTKRAVLGRWFHPDRSARSGHAQRKVCVTHEAGRP